jgi:hypothetical protein
MNTTTIHNVSEIERVCIRKTSHFSGWITIVLRSVSPLTKETSTHEIRFFSDNISELTRDLSMSVKREEKALTNSHSETS